jgi:hypothetical protein
MLEKNGNAEVDSVAKTEGLGLTKSKTILRNLVLYLLYIGAVVAVGARLGVFEKPSPPPLKVGPMAHPISTATLLNPPAQINQLPKGILAFDAELKQTNIYKAEAQAHFTFNLTNISRQPVVIDGVNTSCGCTAAQLPQTPWTLKPRENGQIQVTVSVLPVIDHTTKSVTLITPLGIKTLMVEVSVQSDTNLTARGSHQ